MPWPSFRFVSNCKDWLQSDSSYDWDEAAVVREAFLGALLLKVVLGGNLLRD